MEIHPLSACLIALLLFASTSAAPARRLQYSIRTCSRYCRVPKESKFKYFHNQVYDYSYQVNTATFLSQSPQLSTQLVIDAVAQIHVISTCEMVLKLREVHITETDPTRENYLRNSDNSRAFREQLEKQPLRFAFQDGWIADVCPSVTESTWALNVKRGFLSAFQNRMNSLDTEGTVSETDVTGTCQTAYHVTGSGWFSKTVKKSRDLSTCSRKRGDQSANSKYLHTVLTGSQECDQAIDWNGILISATCVERHHFRPVPGQTEGPVTQVSQTIKFLQKRERKAFSPPLIKRLGLEYGGVRSRTSHRTSGEDDRTTDMAFRRVKGVLRELCTHSEVLPETTDLFFHLVANVRKLNRPSLRNLHEKSMGASVCYDQTRMESFFLDALAMAGTDESVRLLVKMATSRGGGADPVKLQLVLASLAFLPHVTGSMLEAAKTLLDHEPLSLGAMLPVSSMVYTYCQANGGCDVSPDVHRIMGYFRRAIGAQCYAANNINITRVLMALQAIGNAGHVSYMTEVLDNCLKRKNNPLDVRVAAAAAFRRMPCRASRKKAQQVFEDTSEPSELRIAAYQTIMHCARKSDFLTLERTLAAETDSQLLNFVFTHLSNLEKKNETFRGEIESVFRNVDFSSKQLGRLLLSRHLAGNLSDHFPFDANLVFPFSETSSSHSSMSWIPRSSSASLALDFLGKKVDLAELGVRGEGLDFVVENVFLPMLGKRRPYVGPKKMREKLKMLKTSMFARVLGQEVAFLQMSGGTDSILQQLATGKWLHSRQLLAKLSTAGKASLSHNVVLLDRTATEPTSCGLSLSVSINSTMSALLNVSGFLDIGNALTRPRGFHVNLFIQPRTFIYRHVCPSLLREISAALRVTGTMAMDAVVTRSALRMTGTLHSSTALKGRVQMDRSKLFKWEVDVPRDKMIILDARTEMSFLYKTKEYRTESSQAGRPELTVCTGSTGITLLGLDLCGEVRLPQHTPSLSHFLLRPSSLGVVLYKKDTMTQYKLFAEQSKTANSLKTHLSFSTPGSQVDRTLEFYLDGNLKQRRIELRMISPWKKVAFSGAVLHVPRVRGVRFLMTVDHNVTFKATAEVSVRRTREGFTYNPLLELRHPGLKPVIASGTMSVGRSGRMVSLDVSLSGFHRVTPNVKGVWTNSKREVSVRAAANLGTNNIYSIACGSYVTVTGKQATGTELSPFLYINTPTSQLISLSGRGEYRKQRSLRADVKVLTEWTRPFLVQCGMVRTPSRSQTHYRVDARIKSSAATVAIDTRASVKAWSLLSTRLTFSHDIPHLLPKDTVFVTAKLAGRYVEEHRSVLVQSQLESKAYSQYDYDVKMLGDWRPSNTLLKLFCAQGTNYKLKKNYVALTSKLRHDVTDWLHVSLTASGTMEMPSENIYMECRASHTHDPNSLETKGLVNYGDNQQRRAKLIIVNKSAELLRVVGKVVLYVPDKKRRQNKKRVPDFLLNVKLAENHGSYELTAGAHAGRKKRDFSSALVIQKPVSLRRIRMYSKGIPYFRSYQNYEAEFTHTMHPLLADVIESLVTERWAELDVTKPLRLLGTVGGASLLTNVSTGSTETVGADLGAGSWGSQAAAANLERLISALESGDVRAMDGSRVEGPGKMDIRGSVDLKSSFVDLTSYSLNFFHLYNGHDHRTDVTFANNGDEYRYRTDFNGNFPHWLRRANGTMVFKSPDRYLAAEWKHRLERNGMRSTLGSSWWKNRQFYFDLNGQADSNGQLTEMFGDVILQSPWKPIRDWRVSVGHGSSPSFVRTKSTLRRNGVRMTSHDVLVIHTPEVTDVTTAVFTPWTREMSGSLVSRRDAYPVTGTLELQWNPRRKVSVTTSASVERWDDAEASLLIKTTLMDLHAISVEMSNKMEYGDLVSVVTAKYGPKIISAESSIRRNDFRGAHFRVQTPFDHFRVLDTGFQVDGDLNHMRSNVNFRIHPIVKKYDASLTWTHENEFTGKFRLDTPLESFPYVQLVARSDTKGRHRTVDTRGRHRTVDIILKHHPFQVYSCHVIFDHRSPEEVTVTLKTPYDSYNEIVIHLQRERVEDSRSRLTVKVLLPPNDRDIVAVGLISAAGSQIRGDVSLSAPDSGLQTSVSFVHSLSDREFSTRVNITADDKRVSAHALLRLASDVNFPHTTAYNAFEPDRMIFFLKQLQSVQVVNLALQAGRIQHQDRNVYAVTWGPEHNINTTVLMLYDGSTPHQVTQIKVVTPFMDAVTVNSKYTREPDDRSFGLSASYGSRFSVNGTAALLMSRFKSEGSERVFPNTQTMALNRRHEYVSFSDSSETPRGLDPPGLGDRINGVSVHLETKLPYLALDRYRIDMNVKRNSPGFLSNEALNSVELKHETNVIHSVDINVWAKSSHEEKVGMSLELGHETLADLFNTHLQLNSSLGHGRNGAFFAVRAGGAWHNLTAAARMKLKESEVFDAKIRHIHGTGLLNSSVIVNSDTFENLALTVGYLSHLQDLATNVSLGMGRVLFIKGLFVHNTDSQGVRTLKSAFGMNSTLTNVVNTFAEVHFHPLDPWSNVRTSLQAQQHNKLANVNFTLGKETFFSLLARVGEITRQTNPGLDKLAREIQFMYNSTQKRFKSSVFVGQQESDAYAGAVDIRYDTLYDFESRASLRSPLRLAEDLSLQVENRAHERGEKRALLSFGWAPYQKVSVDAVTNHRPSLVGLTHSTDVVLITPFRDLQTGSLKIRHSRVLARTDSSLETTVNGRIVLDLGLNSNDPTVLGVKQSFLNFFQKNAVGFSPREKSHRGHVVVRWDLADPDSELRVDATVRMSLSGVPVKRRQFSCTVSGAGRAFALNYRTMRSAGAATGEGEVRWDEDEDTDRKAFYSYSGLRDLQPPTSRYRGHVRLGWPIRCVEANGSLVTDTPGAGLAEPGLLLAADRQSSLKAEGVVLWDAARDRRKHVTLTSTVVRREDRFSAEVTLGVPVISQEYRLNTSLLASTKHTLWDSTTAFSYTPDPTDTLTFTSTLLNMSSTNGQEAAAYTMATSLTQPSSDLDMGLNSRILRNETQLAGVFEGWYVDCQRERRTLAGKGVFHRLARKLNTTVRTRTTEMSLEVEVPPSRESHALDVRGHVRDLRGHATRDRGGQVDKEFTLHSALDPFHRSLIVRFYGEDPNRVHVLEAWYVNDSAIRVEVYRTHVTGSNTDSTLTLRLNSSTMLHARLLWRPEMSTELQVLSASLQSRFDGFTLQAMRRLLQARQALETEISQKSAAVVTDVAEEVRPLLRLLKTEIATMEQQMESLSRDIDRLLAANEQFLQSLLQPLEETGDILAGYLQNISATSQRILTKWAESLSDEMANSAVVQYYHAFITDLGRQISMAEAEGSRKLAEILTYVDFHLLMLKNRLQEISSAVYPLDDLYTYADVAKGQLGSLNVSKLHVWAQDQTKRWLAPLATTAPMTAISSSARELYKQVVWMYSYLYVTNSHRRLDSIADSLRDIVLAEIRFRLRHFRFLRQSRVTVWRPERGQAEAEVCLPFPVTSLFVTELDVYRLWRDLQGDVVK